MQAYRTSSIKKLNRHIRIRAAVRALPDLVMLTVAAFAIIAIVPIIASMLV